LLYSRKPLLKADSDKTRRQNKFIETWINNKGKGTLEASTGFGKTYVAILLIQKMQERKADRTTLVVVPTLKLKSQWEDELLEYSITGVKVVVINTVCKKNWVCSLLVLDEIHNYASEVFGTVFQRVKYSFILGLTATMERSDKKHYYIEIHCPVIDRVGLSESLEKKFISDFMVYNVPVPMTDAEEAAYNKLNKQFYKFFALFEHSLDNAMKAVKDPTYRKIVAKRLNWTERDVMVFAMNFVRSLQKRKQFLYNLQGKAHITLKLLEALRLRTITFSEGVDYVNHLYERSKSYSVPYHSKLTKKVRTNYLKMFEDPSSGVRVIHTAKALDEGFNVEGIECALIISGTSTVRQNLQRMGRSLRFVEGKTGIIINLYVPDTQDERWLDKRQKDVPNIEWCDSAESLLQLLRAEDQNIPASSGFAELPIPLKGIPFSSERPLWDHAAGFHNPEAVGGDNDGI
jgi:superfamily II DNA or RNA helicase